MNFFRDASPLLAKLTGMYRRLRSEPPVPEHEHLVVCRNVPSLDDCMQGVETAYEGLVEDFYSSEKQEFTKENCTKVVYENLSARTPDFATREIRIDQSEVVLDDVSGFPFIEMLKVKSVHELQQNFDRFAQDQVE